MALYPLYDWLRSHDLMLHSLLPIDTTDGDESPSKGTTKDSATKKVVKPKAKKAWIEYKEVGGTTMYEKGGITYFVQPRVGDHQDLERHPAQFVYTEDQRTLICCECDFSFTASIIKKRRGGFNLCSTSYYDYTADWYGTNDTPGLLRRKVGSKAFRPYCWNLKYCKKFGAKTKFGVDATTLKETEDSWVKSACSLSVCI